jgi:tol-pal system protein YbgF
MFHRLTGTAVAVLLLFASGAAHATASNKELEARAEEMDARLRTVERASQGLVQLQQQIEAARQELRSLRGQIEEAKHELESTRQQQRDLYADLDRRLLLLENAAGTTAPAAAGAVAASAATGAAPTQTDIVAADETAVYGDAFAALKAARYDEAIRGFQLYLAKYPQGPRADNATYWLGEAHYVTKDYDAALKSFGAVLDGFPESRKAPDALLKLGYCQYELKAFRNARVTLEKVVVSYPGTDAARLAEQRLTKMNDEGR